jgi:intein-encoded DNA endonuclease-like protein
MEHLIKLSKKAQAMYIQGFADGEGCCAKHGKQIIITQKLPHILEEIRLSLNETFGIKSTLVSTKSGNAYRLLISGQVNIKRYHQYISFRDARKQERLLLGINSFGRKSAYHEEYLKALDLHKKGYSIRKIANEIGVSHGAVFRWIHNTAKPVSLPKRNKRDISVN